MKSSYDAGAVSVLAADPRSSWFNACRLCGYPDLKPYRFWGCAIGGEVPVPSDPCSSSIVAGASGAEASEASAIRRICVVDDDEEMQLFVKQLGTRGNFEVVGSYYTGTQALERLPEERPDAVIMDIRLPDLSGLDCTSRLTTILPGLPVIILTGFPDAQVFFRSLMGGAKGFLVKPIEAQQLLEALRDVLRGDFAMTKEVVPFLVQVVNQVSQVTRENLLTRREEEILACLFEGLQDKEIASRLGIGTATVHTHMHRLFEKLGVHSRREIVAKYLQFN